MTARRCFRVKLSAGRVSARAGEQLLGMLDEFERQHQARLGDGAAARQAALDAAEAAQIKAARQADLTRRSIVAQANVLRAATAYAQRIDELRAQPGALGFGNQAPPTLGKETQTPLGYALRSLLARDIWEVASWTNVNQLARDIRGRAHAQLTEAIELMRPKALGFVRETVAELDVLRALYGADDVDPRAAAVARAWRQVNDAEGGLAAQFRDAGGALPERKNWRLPNPGLDEAKVRAFGRENFKTFVRDRVDRADMLDFATGKPLTDVRFEQLLDEVFTAFERGWAEGPPSAAPRGRRMLANERDFARVFVWKDAESWLQVAEAMGTHASVFDTMMGHVAGMSDDIALMRVLGPNPEATKRFMLDLLDREETRLQSATPADGDAKAIAAATRANRKLAARVRVERKLTENLYAEVTGANRVPVNTESARTMGEVRAWLTSAQLGSAMLSSLTDPGTMMMVARLNGLSATRTLTRAIGLMTEKGAELHTAQLGFVADSLAHTVGRADQVMGEVIRTGTASKLAQGVIRASGLRRWTQVLRSAFAQEMLAHVARERGRAFGELGADFRETLGRYAIGEAEWNAIRGTEIFEPRPGALFVRPMDVADRGAGEKLQRLVNQEMDYAVIEGDPVARALLLGSSQPGTLGGEVRRAVGMYRSFPTTFLLMHGARALARGWDGSRMGYAATTFVTMTLLGALAMQAKEIAAGRDPLNLDPTEANGLRAWGKAILQGGGFGVFGDLMFMDQTRYGNTWAATAAGPIAGAVESVLGDFLIKNLQLAAKGEKTHWLGDAAYIAARYTPGASLWPTRLAFNRAVADQLALWADDRSRERFRRIEETARKEFGQSYWWRPGRLEPARAPDFAAIGGAQ